MKFFLYLFSNILYFSWLFVPVKKNRWSFASWGGTNFSDNPKYLFKYIEENCKEINPKFLIKIKNQVDIDNNIIYANSFTGIIHLMTSEVVIFTHSAPWDFNKFFVNPRSFHCLTWHGRTIKKIGNHLKVSKLNRFKKIIFPILKERIDLTICLHPNEINFLETAFSISPDKIVPTGFPRNDVLVDARIPSNNVLFNKKDEIKVIYVPTYRNNKDIDDKFEEILENFIIDMDNKLLNKFINITLKLHPAQIPSPYILSVIKKSSVFNIFDSNKSFSNINLKSYDVLISDYSSIIFDYMLLKRPFILFQPDLDYYKNKDKGFIEDEAVTKLILDSPYQYETVAEIASKLIDLKNSEFKIDFDELEMIHKNLDNLSSMRLTREIIKRVNGK
jgi:CDP-glycerol glycerophosphotransferase (TagB/SpsB family)